MEGLQIAEASDAEREWAAELMARSEPWITLGRGLEQSRNICRNTEDIMFVGRADGALCGFILMRQRGLAGSPYIPSVAVAEAFRGRGVGGTLLRFAEDFFRAESRHIFLCVSSFNPRARALYERLGFAAVGEFKDYIIPGANEILMHKRLS